MQNQQLNKTLNFQNSPVAWFAVLERAKQYSDFELAAKAKQELERLGVTVKYHKAQQQGDTNEQ